MTNIERDYSSNDDLNYFIEKIRNRGKVLAVTSYSASNEPEYVSHYLDFMQQYIGFTLTNISGIYNELANWIKNKPAIRDKIHIIDSNDIGSEVFNYVRGYLDKKLTPSVHAIALSLLGISSKQAGINLETHNIPALAFLSPPGTSKTYSIVDALKKLSEGQGNSIIAGWLHYDVTKHEATTSPLVLPTANQDVKDEPLPGLALLRASGHPELDKALRENIYTKTVNKIVSTFGYILIAGKEKGVIPLSNEVENTLKQGINLNSTELSMWKLAVMDKPDKETISTLIDVFRNVIPGFARVTNVLQKNKQYINNNADDLINAINYSNFEAPDPEKDVQDFCEIALILHKLITFSLVPIIAISFRNFIRAKKLDENTNANVEVLDGIMYIYNKVHNDYLHRVISTVFLIKALLNTDDQYDKLFNTMIENLKVGLNKLLNDYYNSIGRSEGITTYFDLEKQVASLDINRVKVFNFYNKIYMFLINAQPKEKDEYVLLDKMFMDTVLEQLVLDFNNTTISSGSSELEETRQTENIQYRSNKARQYSDVDYPEAEFDYFSDNKLSFTDYIRLIGDTINDFYEARRFYSNVAQSNLSNQEGKTTLEKLKSEFGTRFLDLNNTRTDDIAYILNIVFKVIKLFKEELTKVGYEHYEDIYENNEQVKMLHHYKRALTDLFKKSLNAIVYSPRHGHLINNNKLGTRGIDIFGLVGDYILSGLGITESLQTKGVSYSFPPAVQVFLARAKQAYYKYLRQLRAMIEANMKRMDVNNSINKAIETLRPPLYVLFLDEIMTHLTPENFLFWLNIWNGLISPANPTVDTYPPNLCFVLAGNMPWSTFILFEALAQSSTETSHQELMAAFKDANTNIMISEDTIHALGSRISLRIVAYDYAYLLRTDDSAVRTRTALFVRALTKGLLNRKDLIHFANTAQNLLGGFYDYYKLIVLPRLEGLGNLRLDAEKKMKLHAYIASLTAAPDNIPFNLAKIEPNATIRTLIEMDYSRYVSQDKMDEAIKNATILNYLFNSETFGKTIYEYMFGTYFKENPKEADYFNRLITIAISPIVLHLSFLHSYLAWNNMMRRLAKQLLNKAKINQEKPEIVDAATKLMQVIKNASKLLNTKMTTAESIERTMGKIIEVRDRLDSGTYEASRDDFITYIRDERDPRFCDPEVGAVISLLSLVFYHYIKYMKEFNENISHSILEFCEKLGKRISEEAQNYTREFNNLKYKIYNYFVDHSTDIDSREDLLKDATVYLYDSSQSVRINILSFDPRKDQFKFKKAIGGESFGTYPKDADNSITVTLIPEGDASKASKGLNSTDIEAIKALVAYTIYTHSLVSKKAQNFPASDKLIFSQDLIGNIIVTDTMHVPLVGHLALGFFRPTDENKLFLIQPLREADRWFTNVTGSVVKYVTIMTILKHILAYRYIKNSPNMIEGFMNEVKNSNAFSKSVEEALGRILDEFAELLFEARQAVFTPLANGGKENQNNQYRVFNYEYLDTAGTKSEGYYTTPDNKVNFGPLDFVFKELKGINIVQYDNSTHNSENNGERVIETIAEKFIQYLKSKKQSSTTSFFPIHLISHIKLQIQDSETKASLEDLLTYNNISSWLYRNNNNKHITIPEYQTIEDVAVDLRHEGFYSFNKREYSIYAIIKMLNDGLKAVKRTNEAPIVIKDLIEQNNKLEELYRKSDINSDNFMKLLHKARMQTVDYQNVVIRDGVFEDLKKVVTKYPSVNDYVKLWFEEKDNIKLFFKNLLEAIAEQNLDDLSSTVIGVLRNLDTYIEKTAKQLLDKVSDENIRGMLKQISEKDKLDESIESIIRGIMNSDLTNYIAVDIDKYKSLRENAELWKECIKYQLMLLSPLIKYSLAIILSNMFLLEIGDMADKQGINKEQFYSKLKQAIENSYNKTIKDSDRGSSDYLSMIIRYIFFDMNQYDDNDKEMRLSGELIAKTQLHFPQDPENQLGGYTSHYNLVQPFFTHYEGKENVVEKDKQNDKDIIKKRVVFTQYVYVLHNEQPILYCDIHHMPIKGIQKIDGTVVEVPSKITIYSSEEFKSDQFGYAYAQLTFMRNTVVPRYEFAKSALVNLLLIAGIQEIQNSLLNPQNIVSSLFNARFASFAITNLYKYYYDEIKDSNNSAYNLIDKIIYNRKSSSHHKHLHPLLAAIILSFNRNDETVKQILQNDYGLGNPGTYSRRDDFINALRLRFYSSTTSGAIQSAEYDMYSIYEPGVSIK